MAFKLYPRDLKNLEALVADQMDVRMDEMDVEERLRIFNRNIDSRYVLDRMKDELAAAVSRLYFDNFTWGNKPQSEVTLTVPGKSAGFDRLTHQGKKGPKDVLAKMLRMIAKLDEYPYIELTLSYGLQPAILPQLLLDVDEDSLLSILPLLDYQCLFTLRQGHELHLCTLVEEDDAAQLLEIQPHDDLSQTEFIQSWSSNNFLISASYPLSTPIQSHERILAVMKHFADMDGSEYAKQGMEEEWEGFYNPNMNINVAIKGRELSKDVALLQELAKEVKSIGGEMELNCHLRGEGTQFAIVVIEGDQDGVTAKTACLPEW